MNRNRLATVVRIRGLQERIARGEVARDRVVVDTRRRVAASTTATLDQASQRVPAAASGFVAHRRVLDEGTREVTRAVGAVDDARQRLGATIADWTLTAQRLEGVERLAQRAAAQAEADQDHAARTELDDLVVMRWEPEVGR